jgi:hypothetical protein
MEHCSRCCSQNERNLIINTLNVHAPNENITSTSKIAMVTQGVETLQFQYRSCPQLITVRSGVPCIMTGENWFTDEILEATMFATTVFVDQISCFQMWRKTKKWACSQHQHTAEPREHFNLNLNVSKTARLMQRYVLPYNRHCRPIAITKDDPTRRQLPIGVFFCEASAPKCLAFISGGKKR